MGKVSIEDIKLKLSVLSYDARKEVYDFMSFLIYRQKRKKKSDKDRLLDVSVWSKNDIKALESVAGDINRWTIEKL